MHTCTQAHIYTHTILESYQITEGTVSVKFGFKIKFYKSMFLQSLRLNTNTVGLCCCTEVRISELQVDYKTNEKMDSLNYKVPSKSNEHINQNHERRTKYIFKYSF